jgi:hypothetical protein
MNSVRRPNSICSNIESDSAPDSTTATDVGDVTAFPPPSGAGGGGAPGVAISPANAEIESATITIAVANSLLNILVSSIPERLLVDRGKFRESTCFLQENL